MDKARSYMKGLIIDREDRDRHRQLSRRVRHEPVEALPGRRDPEPRDRPAGLPPRDAQLVGRPDRRDRSCSTSRAAASRPTRRASSSCSASSSRSSSGSRSRTRRTGCARAGGEVGRGTAHGGAGGRGLTPPPSAPLPPRRPTAARISSVTTAGSTCSGSTSSRTARCGWCGSTAPTPCSSSTTTASSRAPGHLLARVLRARPGLPHGGHADLRRCTCRASTCRTASRWTRRPSCRSPSTRSRSSTAG